VQVRYDEGVAIHIGPKPCAIARKGEGEASAGECTGQPSSLEKILSRTPTFLRRRKATRREALERAPRRSGVVGDPGMCRRSLSGNREIPCLTLARISARARVGKVRSRSRQ
jgi:hypothetical protein